MDLKANIKICQMSQEDIDSIKEIFSSDFDEFWSYETLAQDFKCSDSTYLACKTENNIVIGFTGLKIVLDNVEPHSIAAFLLPDKKLEKISQKAVTGILSKHKLLKIIKLHEKTFDEGITTSIFIFESGIPQNNEEIFTCYIKEDGLERVKNQGRQDIKHRWNTIENKWVDIIKKQSGDDSIKWIKPNDCLSYQKDEIPFEVNEEDYIKTMLDYLMFKEEIDVKTLKESIANKVIYLSNLSAEQEENSIAINVERGEPNE